MIVKVELANGEFDLFETGNYKLSTIKDLHPMIVKATVYSGTKKLKSISRPFKFFYKHFTFKSEKVQKQLAEEEKKLAEMNNVVPADAIQLESEVKQDGR